MHAGSIRSGSRRRRRFVMLAGTVVMAGSALVAVSTPALAGTAAAANAKKLPPGLSNFTHCPVHTKGVATCLFSTTSDTTFEIGSTTVNSTEPTTISLGLKYAKDGTPIVVLPTDGSEALQAPAIPLPGGLTGIPGADSGPLAVTATPQLVGLPVADLNALLGANGTGLTLPLDILVGNSTGVLGSDCTIGDAATPVTLNLTTGTTDPPGPNTPITGDKGTLVGTPQGTLTDSGLILVDNAFAVPGADNCGSGGALDEILDLDKSLPSAAGSNTAILDGTTYTAPAKLVKKYLRHHSS